MKQGSLVDFKHWLLNLDLKTPKFGMKRSESNQNYDISLVGVGRQKFDYYAVHFFKMLANLSAQIDIKFAMLLKT